MYNIYIRDVYSKCMTKLTSSAPILSEQLSLKLVHILRFEKKSDEEFY